MERGKPRLADAIWDYDDHHLEAEIVEEDARNSPGRRSGGREEIPHSDFFFYSISNYYFLVAKASC